jgi:HSP20 family molecular chaperone IbpA
MARIEGMSLAWRPEMGDGAATNEEIETLKRSLSHADRGQVGVALHPSIPMESWVGEREVLIAAQLPGFGQDELKVSLDGVQLRILATHPGQTPKDQTLSLPFEPDPQTVRILYVQGILFIHLVSQSK